MSSWVKVSDRLPPFNEAVWVYDEVTIWVGALCIYDGEANWGTSQGNFWWNAKENRWKGDFHTHSCYNPTHWAPLITPPSKYPSADRVYP